MILLFYDHPLWPQKSASTIMEHVDSFSRFSRFGIHLVNTRCGFPKVLYKVKPDALILHYSLFGSRWYMLSPRYLDYVGQISAYKIAFFQDEYYYCQQRFEFINRYGIDCIYTLLEPEYYKDVYLKYTGVKKIFTTLTGYVSEKLLQKAREYACPRSKRTIDVGYRARRTPFSWGKGAREKSEIADKFLEIPTSMKLDINTKESSRLYGDAYYRFLGKCRACLGVESGVSIFDPEDKVPAECEELLKKNPSLTFEEVENILLAPYEDRIRYRTISPRHLEAAAFNVCQLLYEGKYQGILKPMVHYIPLKKDFSNYNDVVSMIGNNSICDELTDNCRHDLIDSGAYSYPKFMNDFDAVLKDTGFSPKSEVFVAKYPVKTYLMGTIMSIVHMVFIRLPFLLSLVHWAKKNGLIFRGYFGYKK